MSLLIVMKRISYFNVSLFLINPNFVRVLQKIIFFIQIFCNRFLFLQCRDHSKSTYLTSIYHSFVNVFMNIVSWNWTNITTSFLEKSFRIYWYFCSINKHTCITLVFQCLTNGFQNRKSLFTDRYTCIQYWPSKRKLVLEWEVLCKQYCKRPNDCSNWTGYIFSKCIPIISEN